MKKIVILLAGATALTFTSCKSSQLGSFDDDVYANPAEEQQLARAQAEAKAKAQAEAREKASQEELARQEAENNNPYYKDPKEDADDYYDYKYASRINRFGNPVPGAGYYDSRYTNYYTYTQNPMMFGSSIYSSYNWMPSNQFNNYSMGISLGFGSGYGYSPYMGGYGSMGYPGYYDPFMTGYGYGYGYPSYGFNSFGYYDPFYNNAYNAGYYNGFYNGYNSGWGYYNSFDANSGYSQMTYAPRGSNGGSNSAPRGSNTGARGAGDDERGRFMESMAEKQRNAPRFTETPRAARSANSNAPSSYNPNAYNGNNSANPRNTRNQPGSVAQPQQPINPGAVHNDNNNGQQNNQQEAPARRERRAESSPGGSNNNSSGGRSSGSGGNSSSPRGNGGGSSGSRPR